MTKTIITAVAFLLLSAGLHAFTPRFHHLNSDNGLSSNNINSITKDHKGFIWIGTENGINRFDGFYARSFFNISTDSLSMPGNSVLTQLIDKQRRHWIGTNAGLAYYDTINQTFKRVDIDPIEGSFNLQYHCHHIVETLNGKIVTASPGIVVIYDPKSLEREIILNLDDYHEDLLNEQILGIFVDHNNQLWATTQHRFIIISFSQKESHKIIPHNMGHVRRIVKDRTDKVWVCSENGIFNVDPLTTGISRFYPKSAPNKIMKLFDDGFWNIEFDDKQNIWFATLGSGLIQYNFKTGDINLFDFDRHNPDGISNNNVRAIFVDNKSILWVGTQHTGVDYALVDPQKKFKIISPNSSSGKALSMNIVTSISEDDKYLWVGTDGGGLNLIDKKTMAVTHVPTGPGSTVDNTSNVVLTINNDNKGNMWIGGHNSQLLSYNQNTNKWNKHVLNCTAKDCKGAHHIWQIISDSKGKTWLATNHHGVFYENEKGTFDHINIDNFSKGENYALKLTEVFPGEIWAATYGGIVVIDANSKTVKKVITKEEKKEGSLSNSWVYEIITDLSKQIWVGTSQGLNRYNASDSTFTTFGKANGMAGEIINAIEVDKEGFLWISTNKGITKFCTKTYDATNYSKNDGLPSDEYFTGASYSDKQGNIYFGSINGLVYFHPSEIKPDAIPSPVAITDIQVAYSDINRTDYLKIKNGKEQLVFNYRESTISFKYVGLNYIGNNENQYQYMLEGFNATWIDVGTRKEAVFTNLSPGNYAFHIRYKNKDGYYSAEAATINFVILRPWWKTHLFNITATVIMFAISMFAIKMRLRAAARNKKELEEQVKLKTAELESKNIELENKTELMNMINQELSIHKLRLEKHTGELKDVNTELKDLNRTKDKLFTVIAHDLKSPFNSILGFSALLISNDFETSEVDKKEFAKKIYQSSEKLYNLLENLLLWSRNQLHQVEPNFQEFNLTEKIQESALILTDLASTKDINLRILAQKPYYVFADKEMILAILRNLITNAIKFSHHQNNIDISITCENSKVICTVTDYGTGMNKNTTERLFQNEGIESTSGTGGEKGTGLGLMLCHDFIKRNNGQIWVQSELGKGSSISFSLPMASDEEFA